MLDSCLLWASVAFGNPEKLGEVEVEVRVVQSACQLAPGRWCQRLVFFN